MHPNLTLARIIIKESFIKEYRVFVKTVYWQKNCDYGCLNQNSIFVNGVKALFIEIKDRIFSK